jgi:hypothetical protein
LSAFALGLLEIPSIIKSFKKGNKLQEKLKNISVQAVKSSVNVCSLLAGIGLTGALFARKGPAFSLLGMGIGSIAGAYVSKNLQKGVDELVK